MSTETIDAQLPTLFGNPIEVTLAVGRDRVDVTHALRWDGKDVTLDLDKVHEAINNAYQRGYGLTTPDPPTPGENAPDSPDAT